MYALLSLEISLATAQYILLITVFATDVPSPHLHRSHFMLLYMTLFIFRGCTQGFIEG
jgi:hypothetical protein